jgi:hypothetical protein
MISKLRRAGSAFSDGAITAEGDERDVPRSLYDKGTYPLYRIGSNKEGVSAIESGKKRMWQALEEGHTIIMGNGLFSYRSSEMVRRDREWTTFATVTGFTDADCLDVVGDVKRGATTASSAPTGSSSSPWWWGTATAAASSCCGRGSRRHGRRLMGLGGFVVVAGVNGREGEGI